MTTPVRVRFCPSPTGTPHVGLIRTALFNWAYAKHTGGTFVFRIEDTDTARDSEESYHQLLDALNWLGITIDEGEGVGGPYAPYRQSQRGDKYLDVIEKLKGTGRVYESYSTLEEVEARHLAAGRSPKLGYDGFDRDLSADQVAAFRAEGRDPVLRVRMPDEDITFTDLVRGEITFKPGTIPDFAIVRANGAPLYTLVNPVDDALMGITHVLRGEDLLSSTPRQIVLHRALVEAGVSQAVPEFGHLPYVLGEGSKKLSKRDPESNLFLHRERGFIREGLLNYLSLLGWGLSHDRDIFSVDEFIAAFDVKDVNPNPARFDLKKAEAINAQHLRLLTPDVYRERMLPYLTNSGVFPAHPSDEQLGRLDAAIPLVQERMNLLGEAPDMLRFLFTEDADLVVADDAKAALRSETAAVLDASFAALKELSGDFTRDNIEASLKTALLEGLELKPRFAFTPLRIAVSGKKISPPLFESMELLGRDSVLARIQALRAIAPIA